MTREAEIILGRIKDFQFFVIDMIAEGHLEGFEFPKDTTRFLEHCWQVYVDMTGGRVPPAQAGQEGAIMKLPEEYQLEFLQTRVEKLERALKDVFELMDTGWLVRSVSNDADLDWALKQIEPVQKLARARELIHQVSEVGT